MTRGETTADVIVIGGGVAGLSTAMQLGRGGASVLVLERQQIGNGSSGRAAGLLGQLRGTAEHTRMLMDGVQLVKELEALADLKVLVQNGSLRIAQTSARAGEIARLVDLGKSIGLAVDHLAADDVARLVPYMKTDDLLDACYCPTDGYLRPAELVAAYVKIGTRLGVRYIANCPVSGITVSGGRPESVQTPRGSFSAPCVVNAAGPWSYLVAGLVDEALPTAALRHIYLTTAADPEHPVDPRSPAVRDRHTRIYSRPDRGGLIVGFYGDETLLYDMTQLPLDFDMSAMQVGLDETQAVQLLDAARQRFPWIRERSRVRMTAGIMTFTPDGQPLCGKLPGWDGFYHCAGFCGHGIVQSASIGVIMSQLILDGHSTYDIAAIEADRYFDLPGFQSRREIQRKCYQMYAAYYGSVEGTPGPVQPWEN